MLVKPSSVTPPGTELSPVKFTGTGHREVEIGEPPEAKTKLSLE